MGEFDSFFLMDTESVKRYAVEVLHLFAPGEETVCEEIGDGNINYVFRIRSLQDGHSAVVKQADRLLRSSGRLLDQNRSRIEAAILNKLIRLLFDVFNINVVFIINNQRVLFHIRNTFVQLAPLFII